MAKYNNTQDLHWEEYEEVTKYIYEMLGARYGIKIVGHGRNFWLKGKSGVKHQVDVLTEQREAEKVHLTAIECKFLKNKVTKETVMKLHSIMVDADITSGIIVCKMGFTRDTLTYAEHLGIRLVDLREAKDDGREGEVINIGILNIDINATLIRPTIVCIDLGSLRISDEDELMAMRFDNYAFILTPEGRKIPFRQYVDAYCKELNRRNLLLKTITVDYPLVQGKLVRQDSDDQLEIGKISFMGFLCKMDKSSKRSFQLIDQVWMIMREIFEKKSYKLSKGGILFGDNHEWS